MMGYGTNVQWQGVLARARVPGVSVDPLAQGQEEEERLTLDLPVSAIEFLGRYAAYRNALNEAQKRKMKRWTRKSAAEAFLMAQVAAVIESMREAFAEHGELPADEKQMLAYAERVLASYEKPTKKSSK